MKHYFQPENSSTCGQHCVAMVSGITPEKSIELFKSKGGTRTKQLHEVFKLLGFKTENKLSRIKIDTKLPDLCILKIVYSKTHSHWVVYNKGIIYCSGRGIYDYSEHEYIKEFGKATSYLEIKNKD